MLPAGQTLVIQHEVQYEPSITAQVQHFTTKEVFLHRRSSPDLEKCQKQKPLLITQHEKRT